MSTRCLLASVLIVAGCSADPSIVSQPETASTTTSSASDSVATAVPTTSIDGSDSDTAPTPTGPPEATFDVIAEVGPLTDATVDPSGEQLIVVEQRGRVIGLSEAGPVTILDLTDRTAADGERGLLGATYTADGTWLVVNLTSTTSGQEGDTVVTAFPVTDDGSVDEQGEQILLTVDQPYANHNGGDLFALEDSTLLVATGDGGSGGDPERVAHRLDQLLGKILRINTPGVDGLPADNPWIDQPDARGEIWSSGLRNPWKIDVDPLSGDLWVADVGQNLIEEISRVPANSTSVGGAGVDFGWSSFEGDAVFNDDVEPDPRTTVVAPIHVYEHGDAGCSISGGMMYRGSAIPNLWGWFVFADFCAGDIRALDPSTGEVVSLGNVTQPTAVVRGIGGEPVIVTATGQVISVGPP